MNATTMELASILISLVAFLFAAWLFAWVKEQPLEHARIEQVCGLIRKGARVFLKREFQVLGRFCLCAGALIFLFLPSPIWPGSPGANLAMVMSYFAGALFSGFAGKIGIEVATMANGNCAVAARRGIAPSFMTGFRGGAVMGMAVVGASLLASEPRHSASRTGTRSW